MREFGLCVSPIPNFRLLVGLVLAVVGVAPCRASDCTDAKASEIARVERVYDGKLSELTANAAANPDYDGLNLAAIERRIHLLRKTALKRIAKAARACARDRGVDRISRVADLYISRKLQAAVPARLASREQKGFVPEPIVPARSSAAPADRAQIEVPTVPVPDRPLVVSPSDVGAKTPKPAPTPKPQPEPLPQAAVVQKVPERAAPGPPPVPRQPVAKSVEEEVPVTPALKTLVDGKIVFDRPKTVRLDHAMPLHAKLSALSPADMPMRGPTPDDQKAQGRIAATLSGGNALSISPAGSQIQWVTPRDSTLWRWEITPKAVGRQVVTLSLDAIRTIDGKDIVRHLRTVTHQFDVDVAAPAFSPRAWVNALETRFGNVSWLWAIILVPIGLVLRRRRRRSSDATAE